MSVVSYDENLIEKLKSWTANTQINIYGPDESSRLFEVIADNTKDKPIALPIIALSRPNGFTVKNTNKQPLTYDGYRLDSNEDTSLVLNAIPILLEYQLDIYTYSVLEYMEQHYLFAYVLILSYHRNDSQ